MALLLVRLAGVDPRAWGASRALSRQPNRFPPPPLMAGIRFPVLVDRIVAALGAAGWGIVNRLEGQPVRPARLVVRPPATHRRREAISILVYAWSATHGGKTRKGYEFRVQMTGVTPPLAREAGAITILLGLSPGEGVMTAWDPAYHENFTAGSSSLQTRREAIDAALATGWGFHRRENDEIAVSFLDEYLAPYIEAQHALHAIDSIEALEALERAAGGEMALAEVTANIPSGEVPAEFAAGAPAEDEAEAPERLTRFVRQTVRDQSFSRRVLVAYDYTCCGCGVQLGLVQGAHIIPVAARPNYSTRNGLALCANHHLAYDNGLFAVDRDYRIAINAGAVRTLAARGLGAGTDLVLGTLREYIGVPHHEWDRPAPHYLVEAVRYRFRPGKP